ncbi:MAG: diguanylate cyclase, partial [Clostridiaceae bacterium]|nr:diguanylate cyclase [Clostridiaceae bacterium]
RDSIVDFARQFDLGVFSAIILLILLFSMLRNIEKRHRVSNQLFAALLVCILLQTVFDFLSWVWEDLPGQAARMANLTSNLILYLVTPLPAVAWLLYVHEQLFGSRRAWLRLAHLLAALVGANAILALWSLKTGWFFSVDLANDYQRGPLFILHALIPYGLLLVSFVMILRANTSTEPELNRALLVFIVPPLIVYLRIQNRGLSTDALTGTFNRRHFERIIQHKLSRAGREGFSVIIADLNDFKQINDRFGHAAGDEALQQAVQLLRQTLRQDDLIARFGGDEFYVLLDIHDENLLQEIVRRIEETFTRYSTGAVSSYPLSVSMGAAVYQAQKHPTAAAFLAFVDQLMYQDKNRRQVRVANMPF